MFECVYVCDGETDRERKTERESAHNYVCTSVSPSLRVCLHKRWLLIGLRASGARWNFCCT